MSTAQSALGSINAALPTITNGIDQTLGNCIYCGDTIIETDDYLECMTCHRSVHIKCLKHGCTPGDLHGDIFFNLTCAKCVQLASTGPTTSAPREKFERQSLPWVIIISLVIYNLTIKSQGLGVQGFFHWRSHIAAFIEKNWKILFPPMTRKPKRWLGSISGTLSHNNPKFFTPGQSVVQEGGWWKLAHGRKTPRFIYNQYKQISKKRQHVRLEKNAAPKFTAGVEHEDVENEEIARKRRRIEPVEEPQDICQLAISNMTRKAKSDKDDYVLNVEDEQKTNENDATTDINKDLADFLADFLSPTGSQENSSNLFDITDMKDGEALNIDDDWNFLNSSSFSLQESLFCSPTGVEQENACQPRIIEVKTFETAPNGTARLQELNIPSPKAELDVHETVARKPLQEQQKQQKTQKKEQHKNSEHVFDVGLFRRSTKRNWPWLVQTNEDELDVGGDNYAEQQNQTNADLVLMSEYEERELLQKMQKIFACETKYQLQIPTSIRRFYRKLCVRDWERRRGRAIHNLDRYTDENFNAFANSEETANIIDRFHLIAISGKKKTFYARLAGSMELELFKSPYTERMLPPFIFRSKTCVPPWVKLMSEMQHAVTKEVPTRAPIDYCYVRPNHIAAVNSLLQMLFWPGIDMTDCLNYPDFSVVAMYRKLVIGCGFLVPDVGYNEAYLSFLAVRPGWQRSGIATFMLYHLIQTCRTKDITLHVSCTNPASLLYQKFGFKIEEIILHFYDKYLPLESRESRNAYLMRLTRS